MSSSDDTSAGGPGDRRDAAAARCALDPARPAAGRPRPYSVSGVFPSFRRLVRVLPALDGVDRRQLVDLPRALQTGAADDGHRALAAALEAAADDPSAARNIMGPWDLASRYGLLVEGDDHHLTLTRRGAAAVAAPRGRVLGHLAGREGLLWILDAVARGAAGAPVDGGAAGGGLVTLAELLPGWRTVLEGNRRFASPASHPRGLGLRVAALVADGLLAAEGDHAARLADEAGFRGREPEPAFADLGGGLRLP